MSELRDVKLWLEKKTGERKPGQVSAAVIRAYNSLHPDDPYEVPVKVANYQRQYSHPSMMSAESRSEQGRKAANARWSES